MSGRKWTEEDIDEFIELYKKDVPFEEISKKLNRGLSALTHKSMQLKLSQLYPKKNNSLVHKDYHDYEWNYERYILKGMSHQEMADEAGVKLRTIEKWCGEIHNLNNRTFKDIVKLNDLQNQIIISGTLGDGHISASTNRPIYIESHAEDEKDYVFWKYNILKNICTCPPAYYDSTVKIFYGKEYLCKPSYRLSTRIVNQLYEINDMSRCDRILALNRLGYSTHFLDDGSRNSSNWQICLAEWTQEEKDLYLKRLSEEYDIHGKMLKDVRYACFDSISSKKIDTMILQNVDNSLDIIKKKIFNKANYLLRLE